MPSRSSAAVAGSTRSAQPTASVVEHRDRDHGIGVLGERTHAGVGGRLVAGHDEQADPLALQPRPRRRPRPTPRRRRARSAARAGGTRRSRACPRSRAHVPPPRGVRRRRRRGPTRSSDRPVRRTEPLPERAARRDERRERVGRAARSVRDGAARADRDDLGAVPACLPEPEVDDRRAIDDLVVADDHDELGVADASTAGRGTRRAPRRSTRRGRRSARRARGAGARRARRRSRSSPSPRAP